MFISTTLHQYFHSESHQTQERHYNQKCLAIVNDNQIWLYFRFVSPDAYHIHLSIDSGESYGIPNRIDWVIDRFISRSNYKKKFK